MEFHHTTYADNANGPDFPLAEIVAVGSIRPASTCPIRH
jgi:hypothetical protein